MKLLTIDQIHSITNRINSLSYYKHDRRGYATAYMYLMLGEVWLGDIGNDYIYIGDEAHHLMDSFVALIKFEDIPVSVRGARVELPTVDQSFLFVLNNTPMLQIIQRGVLKFDRMFVNSQVDESIALTDFLTNHGDII